MNKFFFYALISLIVFLSSCNASKKATFSVSTKQKLETQYSLYQGVKYKYGGSDKRGFDCSGFTQKVYRDAFHFNLPRTTEEMSELGKKVSKQKLIPGDLVFFRPSRKYKHVGIFIGDNMFIHSSTTKGVTKSKLDNEYWEKKYKYSKRILKTK